MDVPRSLADRLPETERGRQWIAQFDEVDREVARELLESLVLISGAEFERKLSRLLSERTLPDGGPAALFAVREWDDPSIPYLSETHEADAVGPGGDIGSEGRVAAAIRGLCRSGAGNFLNHPSVADMRKKKCREIVLVDDFIGSGDRVAEFYAAIWSNRTIRSWHSRGSVAISVVAYSATDTGLRRVTRLLSKEPELVRGCPTFVRLPAPLTDRRTRLSVLRSYAKRTEFPKSPLGYGGEGTALIFEHGCPDNAPVIFWASTAPGGMWQALFPSRSVLPGETSAFPPELIAPHAAGVLKSVGQKRLASSSALSRRGPLGETILLLLALLSKRVRKRTALAYASGLTIQECGKILERCIAWGFLTPALRLTDAGTAELRFSRRLTGGPYKLPSLGSDEYYPRQLRGSGHG